MFFVGGGFTLAATLTSMDIKDYASQLKQLCVACRKAQRCKDHDKLCALKRLAFSMAKAKYSRDIKKGLIT